MGYDISGLKHLPAVRKALVTIARGQQDMLDLMESGAGTKVGDDGEPDGEDVDDDDEDGQDDDVDDDDDDDEPSELAEAVDAEFVEEEDHGHGDVETVIPEVLPAGARRDASGLTAEDVLDRHRDGGGA